MSCDPRHLITITLNHCFTATLKLWPLTKSSMLTYSTKLFRCFLTYYRPSISAAVALSISSYWYASIFCESTSKSVLMS